MARAARPGHFVMVRVDERGERIPLTVADYDAAAGTVTVVVQAVGKTTFEMLELRAGEYVLDFIGPLGLPSHIRRVRRHGRAGGRRPGRGADLPAVARL